jgi:hypothetical protein
MSHWPALGRGLQLPAAPPSRRAGLAAVKLVHQFDPQITREPSSKMDGSKAANYATGHRGCETKFRSAGLRPAAILPARTLADSRERNEFRALLRLAEPRSDRSRLAQVYASWDARIRFYWLFRFLKRRSEEFCLTPGHRCTTFTGQKQGPVNSKAAVKRTQE